MAKVKAMKQTVLIDLNELGLFNGLGDNSIWISEEVDYDMLEKVAADTGIEKHLIKLTLNTTHYLEAITELYISILNDKLNKDEFEDEFEVVLVSEDSIQIEWTGENAEERFEALLSEIDTTYQDHSNPRAAFELFDVYEEEGYSLEQSFYEFKTQSGKSIAYSQLLGKHGKYFVVDTILLTDIKEVFDKADFMNSSFGCFDEEDYKEFENDLWGDLDKTCDPTETILPYLAMELVSTSFEIVGNLLYLLQLKHDRLTRTNLATLEQIIKALSLATGDYPYDIIVDNNKVTFSLVEGQEVVYDAEHKPITFIIEG